MLEHLLAEATRTDSPACRWKLGFSPPVAARALYARAGFAECGPFEGYHEDPNSVFMTKALR